ncbi:hypothetical protein [Saccharomonospora iraqiensis]|uniref:hypothetical protein n=1 Tax=Saccharomonospora iraqiensis TaxID=52698 RepID=UPI00022E1572|nr:hypothetical protein [Saccharomonospora iraqiensis]
MFAQRGRWEDLHDRGRGVLEAVRPTRPVWPTVNPDEAIEDARRALSEFRPAPDEHLLRRVLEGLYRL